MASTRIVNIKNGHNTTKTKVIVFSRGKIRNKPVVYLNRESLETVDDYVYLGITFNYNGRFQKAVKRLYDKASRSMFEVLK